MGILSKFEGKLEDTVEGAAEKMGGSSISPVQIAKRAERQMRREKMVGAGKQYAPTLYTVLVSQDDDARLFGYYPTLAGETETYLAAKAAELGLVMDGQPLVRFIPDENLKRGKFDVIAEMVAAPIIVQLRQEEMGHYGLATPKNAQAQKSTREAGMRPAYEGRQNNESRPRGSRGSRSSRAASAVPVVGAEMLDAEPMGGRAEEAGASTAADANNYEPAQQQTVIFDQPEPAQQRRPEPVKKAPEIYLYDIGNDRAFALTGQPMRIGRESRNDIVLEDINVSRVHAEVYVNEAGMWVISDLDSTNGTKVNGRLVTSAPLHDADRITLGTTELEFQIL